MLAALDRHLLDLRAQMGAWAADHVGKSSSWSLLVVMTFTIVVHLKQTRARIQVPA